MNYRHSLSLIIILAFTACTGVGKGIEVGNPKLVGTFRITSTDSTTPTYEATIDTRGNVTEAKSISGETITEAIKATYTEVGDRVEIDATFPTGEHIQVTIVFNAQNSITSITLRVNGFTYSATVEEVDEDDGSTSQDGGSTDSTTRPPTDAPSAAESPADSASGATSNTYGNFSGTWFEVYNDCDTKSEEALLITPQGTTATMDGSFDGTLTLTGLTTSYKGTTSAGGNSLSADSPSTTSPPSTTSSQTTLKFNYIDAATTTNTCTATMSDPSTLGGSCTCGNFKYTNFISGVYRLNYNTCAHNDSAISLSQGGGSADQTVITFTGGFNYQGYQNGDSYVGDILNTKTNPIHFSITGKTQVVPCVANVSERTFAGICDLEDGTRCGFSYSQ